MVLILVLVVVALLTLACFTFSRLMLAGRKAAQVTWRQAQARLLADSGLETARWFFTQEPDDQEQLGGWYSNPELFRMHLVLDNEGNRDPGRFTFVAPDQQDGILMGLRFGLEDESNRLNLNVLVACEKVYQLNAQEVLMGLPGMTEEIADAILDWIDEDDEPREFGAESEYYAALQPGYMPKNGPLETVEELLLVREVTPWLLFGADANRNGLLDSSEPDAQNLGQGVDNTDGSMNAGWSSYLTLYSMEQNLNQDGEPKIDLNQDDLETLYDDLEAALGAEMATFVIAYRQNGPYSGTQPAVKVAGELDFEKQGQTKLSSVLDLIGPNTQVTFKGEEQAVVLQTPFPNVPGVMSIYLPLLMDSVAVNASAAIPGRININQAPRVVLEGIPGLSEEAVDQIIGQREPDPAQRDSAQRHETWILGEGIVTLEEMKALLKYVTGGGSVYRAHVIGYFDRGGPAVRIEAVLDTTVQPAKILMYRDLTHLGRGYDPATLGIEDLGQRPSGTLLE